MSLVVWWTKLPRKNFATKRKTSPFEKKKKPSPKKEKTLSKTKTLVKMKKLLEKKTCQKQMALLLFALPTYDRVITSNASPLAVRLFV